MPVKNIKKQTKKDVCIDIPSIKIFNNTKNKALNNRPVAVFMEDIVARKLIGISKCIRLIDAKENAQATPMAVETKIKYKKLI